MPPDKTSAAAKREIAPLFISVLIYEMYRIRDAASFFTKTCRDADEEVMLGDIVDEEFTTTNEIAEAARFLAPRQTLAFTGQSLMISHGWLMQ